MGNASGCETVYYIPEDSNNCQCDYFNEKGNFRPSTTMTRAILVIGSGDAYLVSSV